jgi:hypothetical protein
LPGLLQFPISGVQLAPGDKLDRLNRATLSYLINSAHKITFQLTREKNDRPDKRREDRRFEKGPFFQSLLFLFYGTITQTKVTFVIPAKAGIQEFQVN